MFNFRGHSCGFSSIKKIYYFRYLEFLSANYTPSICLKSLILILLLSVILKLKLNDSVVVYTCLESFDSSRVYYGECEKYQVITLLRSKIEYEATGE